MNINEVIAAKASQTVVTISPEALVRDLIGLLAEHNIGAVIVSTDGITVEGIVSERDIVRRLIGAESPLDQPVSSIMTGEVRSVEPSASLDSTRRLMTDNRFRHVPVVENGQLRGIISIGDVVKAYIDQVEFERDQLDSYVRQI